MSDPQITDTRKVTQPGRESESDSDPRGNHPSRPDSDSLPSQRDQASGAESSASDSSEQAPKPFVAPCRDLPLNACRGWLRKGWQDLKQAPRQSLTYGVIMVALSYAISAAAWWLGNLGLYLGLITGFVFIGPILALTLYDISQRLQVGQPVSLKLSLLDAKSQLSNALVFTVILGVVLLVWARAATMVHIFFPENAQAEWTELLTFLGVGSAVGAVFCAIIFTASAFSLPMLMDRETDTVTAVITSANAVLRNKPAMLVWAIVIVACVVIGVATAYLAFVVLLPLLGHASWHAYQEAIDASDWPPRKLVDSE